MTFMNMFTVSTGLHTAGNYKTKSVFAGNLPGLHNSMLKSAQEKMERQQKAGNEIAFWEKQKENLKQKECSTLEEIAEKLEMFHNYEDEIAAVKTAYNNEQMSHILDEAQEQGEKNAEAAKKLEPKTPEERRKEAAEEAMGTEEDDSILDEMMDDVTETLEEVQEELQETQEQMLDEMKEELTEGLAEEMPDGSAESMSEQLAMQKESIEEKAGAAVETMSEQPAMQKENLEEKAQELQRLRSLSKREHAARMYQRFDMKI